MSSSSNATVSNIITGRNVLPAFVSDEVAGYFNISPAVYPNAVITVSSSGVVTSVPVKA